METEKSANIGARVFRRTDTGIILMWNLFNLTADEVGNIDLSTVAVQEVPLKYEVIDPSADLGVKKDVIIVAINHEENDLAPSGYYAIRIRLGKNFSKETVIKISPVGVLPDIERDQKKQHVQLMGWDGKRAGENSASLNSRWKTVEKFGLSPQLM